MRAALNAARGEDFWRMGLDLETGADHFFSHLQFKRRGASDDIA